jgi:hypothetical protein
MRISNKSRKIQVFYLICFANLTTFLNYILDWPVVKFANFRVPDFTDSQPLKSIKCFSSFGLDIYDIKHESFAECGYNYGSTLLVLGKILGIDGEMYRQISLISALLVSSVIAIVIKNHLNSTGRFTYLFLFLIVASPPITFLFERGNFDQLIFLLVFVAAIAQAKRRRLISFIIITLTALIKFYTFPLLIFYAILNWKFLNKFILTLVPILSLIIILLDISRITWLPSTGGCCQFGSASFSYYFRSLGMSGNQDVWITLGALSTLLGVALMFKSKSRLFQILHDSVGFETNNSNTVQIFIEWTALILVTSYLAGFNYDYRLVFYVTGGLIIFHNKDQQYLFKGIWLVTFFISIWATIGIGSSLISGSTIVLVLVTLVQLVGDLSLFLVVAYIIAIYMKLPLLVLSKKFRYWNS